MAYIRTKKNLFAYQIPETKIAFCNNSDQAFKTSENPIQILEVPIDLTMRVHPAPATNKNLRRLPHIFAKVLELPFQSNTDVLVEDSSGCFRFIVETDAGGGGDVSAKTVDIYPGITKIVVIRGNDSWGLPMIHELEFDIWRFRLPAATLPEMATADYSEGKLIVTVPKDPSHDGSDVDDDEEDGWGEEENAGFVTGPTLVLVQ